MPTECGRLMLCEDQMANLSCTRGIIDSSQFLTPLRYFTADDKQKPTQQCIGAAISDKIHGLYHPVNDFVQCNRSSHGVIDAAWFKDTDGRQYITYKTENPSGRLEIREVAHSGEHTCYCKKIQERH